jgi:protein TonB
MPAAAEIPEPVPAPLKPALERATVQPAAHAPLPKRKPALAPPPIGMAEKAAASRAPVSFAPRPPDRQGNPDTDARPTNAAPSEIASAAAAGAATARPVPPRYAAPGRGNPMPVYPPSARRRGIEGRLVLRVRVDTRGRAATIDIVAGSGHGLLDAAAERAVRKWNFTPARRAGIPVSATLDVPVVFRLRD